MRWGGKGGDILKVIPLNRNQYTHEAIKKQGQGKVEKFRCLGVDYGETKPIETVSAVWVSFTSNCV